MAYQVTTGRFVGRTTELARLRELLARATAGPPLAVTPLRSALSTSLRGAGSLNGSPRRPSNPV
jgi:hypothetical protein